MKTPTPEREKIVDTATDLPAVAKAYNGLDRNTFKFGWNPQAELWNGRLAMIGFLAYLLWDWAGYSVLRDLLHLLPQYVVR
ncbi:MAG: high light inducible protein [Kastovskya adunca ATA6-11-RM4]|jgi:hypothetical protein|nr:high light inducible protein [Kastovskya adunca ATA6-11-RM4]